MLFYFAPCVASVTADRPGCERSLSTKKETTSFSEYYALKNTYFGTEEERSNVNAIQAKKMTHRYCLFANTLFINGVNPRCPGVAEGIVCDDFILAFGALQDGGSREQQAAIFMHELGHALATLQVGNGEFAFAVDITGPASKFLYQPTVAFCDLTQRFSPVAGGSRNICSLMAVASHAGGIQVAMGDGSVRLVNANVTPVTWWSAVTPQGGEILASDW